jgi:hypothetical protein
MMLINMNTGFCPSFRNLREIIPIFNNLYFNKCRSNALSFITRACFRMCMPVRAYTCVNTHEYVKGSQPGYRELKFREPQKYLKYVFIFKRLREKYSTVSNKTDYTLCL